MGDNGDGHPDGRGNACGQANAYARVRERLVGHVLAAPGPAPGGLDAASLADALTGDGRWPDLDYDDTETPDWPPFHHALRTVTLARVPARHPAALRALAAWRRLAPRSANWWFNEIGAPQHLGDAVLLLHDRLTPAQRRDWAAWLAEAAGPVELTGQNLVWSQGVELRRAVLAEDPGALAAAVRRMAPVLRPTREEGIQDDLSFHHHGALPYLGGYGRSLVTEVSRWVHAVHGTPWAFDPAEERLLVDHVLDAHRWALHGDGYDFTLMGREIARVQAHHVAGELGRALDRLLARAPYRRDELAAFAAESRTAAEGGETAGPVGSRAYPRSDHLVHRRPGWSFAVRMSSTRTVPTECLNGENLLGRHLADGVATVRVGGAPEDGYRGVLPVWDWARLPGTTVELPADTAGLRPRPNDRHGAADEVGCWSDGVHGVAVFRLAGTDRFADGWKAWFCLDDAVVALGSGITAPEAERPVVTTVDQRLAVARPTVGGPEGGPPTWVHHGRIGYVPLTAHPVVVVNATSRTGRWSDLSTSGASDPVTAGVFHLGVDHGPRPENAGYAWLILPAADAEATRRRAAAPGVTVLVNEPAHQAVRCDRTGRVLAARLDPDGSLFLGEPDADHAGAPPLSGRSPSSDVTPSTE
ncbi:polysaccharide lyase family 8 super-sandwich domain-containing protein [Streptomyces sedi]|uniref:Silent information regulator protein Sir2 n=1 Tax=Streptomyces sedi TaxID=555059 RepID=A0A5C4USC9_9ACTN|nr:polysaccharide lyase family 8 super-sandwich domain-containing protein [Streptomyces sedi]TNM26507.1 silent information regulator protein Sir2 [Streptomyces sedi]